MDSPGDAVQKGRTSKKSKPLIIFHDQRLLSHDIEPRPLVPLHPELCSVCRFSQCCQKASFSSRVTCPSLSRLALNGRQGPHPPFHSSPLSSASRSCSEQKRFLYQTDEL